MGLCCSAQRPTSLEANLNEVESESERDDRSVATTTTPSSNASLSPSNSSINSIGKYLKAVTSSASNTATKLKKSASRMLRATDTFEPILLSQWLVKEGIVLSEILDEIYIFHIPDEITQSIVLYTIDLLPGIYKFKGRLNYGGSVSLTRGNPCSCQIILNSRSEIVGGSFREHSFKYHITNGSYTLDVPHYIEFTKEYFHRNYKYKVYGQLVDIKHENNDDVNALKLQFRGKWKLMHGARGGNIIMNCIQNKDKMKKKYKVQSGQYTFYGYCDYLPNIFKNKRQKSIESKFFGKRQRVELKARLSKEDLTVAGAMRLLRMDARIDDANNGDKFTVSEKESVWDEYGGIHVVFENNYKMDGFLNDEGFMGVWKDENDQRFGHFHFTKMHHLKDEDEKEEDKVNGDCLQLQNEPPNTFFQRAKSLDSDDDE